MAEPALRLCVRTPQQLVLDTCVRSLRVPSDSGQVGLRPRAEATALGIEPGLVLARCEDGLRFVATAGGLLRCDGKQATLLTPIAVMGASAAEVQTALEAALRGASADLELRNVLQRLQTGLLRELRRAASPGGS